MIQWGAKTRGLTREVRPSYPDRQSRDEGKVSAISLRTRRELGRVPERGVLAGGPVPNLSRDVTDCLGELGPEERHSHNDDEGNQ